MIKTCYSTLLVVFMLVGHFAFTYAQESEEAPVWETIILVPDNSKLKILGENMRKHNVKYHNEGAFKSTVYNISTGPNTGKLIWMMGPLQFSDLDKRPAQGGHDEDWRDNIMPYVKHLEQGEYWQDESDLSNTSMLQGDPGAYPILYTRYWEVNSDHGFGVERHLEMASKAIKDMAGVHPWGVYDNLFVQGNIGRHLATVAFYKNWEDLNTSWSFRASFDKVNGADAWDGFISNRNATFSNWWDEVWVYDKMMSGD